MKLKKINKYANKTHKMKKSKRGGFSWPDISSWKSSVTEKIRNFNLFKKKNPPSSNQITKTNNELPKPVEPTPVEPKPIEPRPVTPMSAEPRPIAPSFQNESPQFNFEEPKNEEPKNEEPKNEEPKFTETLKNSDDKIYGGYRPNQSLTNLASTGAPFWQPTAKPQVWVGGKRKHKKTHKKTKKSKKTHKKRH
jgi:hypothetical protein